MGGVPVDDITVVHVDDDPDILDLAADVIERESPAISVETTTDPDEVLDRLDGEPPVDCIVSDYQLEQRNGLDLYDDVGARDSDVPFVLFTGRGSEEIASEAISAGVTDYIQKKAGTDQYAVLANRIENAVAQRRARAELERYEQIVEIAGDGAYVLDEEGHYEMVNRRTVARTGYTEADLLGAHGSLVFDETDIEKAKQATLDVYRNDDVEFAQFEATVHARDGTDYAVEIRTAPIVEDGRIVGAVGTSRDIADRKRRERELERYELIVETAGDAANVLDASGRYVMVNDALLERTGYDREALIGAHARELVDDADYQRATDALFSVVASEDQDFAELELTVETADGNHYPAEARIAPIVDDGEFRGSVGIIREITDRKRRERELERQNERLGKFAAVVSHDLRNPLNVVQARTELAREGDTETHLDVASDAVERMDRLVDDLLTLAHEGRAVEETRPVEVASVAREAWASVATGDATLTVAEPVTVEGDRSRLRQVLENLFRNAVEHGSTSPHSSSTHEDAVEHGSTSPRSQAREDAVEHGSASPRSSSTHEDAVERDDSGVVVTVGALHGGGFYVADDGAGLCGVDPETIFQPNVTTTEDDTGLGLAIVRDIVEAHGWDIRVNAGAAEGVRFEVDAAPPTDGHTEN